MEKNNFRSWIKLGIENICPSDPIENYKFYNEKELLEQFVI